MNVLLIGGVSGLINQLIRKIKKEGHRVYLLTGSRFSPAGYEKVFVRYDLPYDSESISDAFESVNPDVTLFVGAFDSNFRWANEERELVRLTSGLTNLLTAHSMAGKGRFIFLSSYDVYSESYEADVTEDTPTSPSGMKGIALAQFEDICASFRKPRNMDVTVLRVDHLYAIPKKPDEVNDICSRMCLEALKTGHISADTGRRFSMLYESDTVEFIFQLIRCGEHQHPVYHLSASQELTEPELAGYIQQAMSQDANITIKEEKGKDHRCILSNQHFDGEFGAKIFADTRETVGKVAQYMTAHKELFLTGEQEKESLWKRIMSKMGWLISIGKVYHVTSKLDQYMPEDVLFYAAEILGELLGSGDIAIYTVSNDTYARLFAFTSEQAKSLGKSLRYRELGVVYETLAERKVYVNRELDWRNPMMANLVRLQFIVSVVVFFLAIVLLPTIGFGGMVMRIYPCLAAGYFTACGL